MQNVHSNGDVIVLVMIGCSFVHDEFFYLKTILEVVILLGLVFYLVLQGGGNTWHGFFGSIIRLILADDEGELTYFLSTPVLYMNNYNILVLNLL